MSFLDHINVRYTDYQIIKQWAPSGYSRICCVQTTAVSHPHGVLDLHGTETTSFASQLVMHSKQLSQHSFQKIALSLNNQCFSC
jgi:hypothetical protein